MLKKSILGQFCLCLCLIIFLHLSNCNAQKPFNTFTVSSIKYPRTVLKPYEWRYVKVELPPWFSSMSLALESDVDQDLHKIQKAPGSSFIICFREGSFPLPDVHNTSHSGLVMEYISNSSFTGAQNFQYSEKCYPMQKNILLSVANGQISPGTWYIGLFNGIGAIRTQSKMINRGSTYFFSGNISVEGCMTSSMLGQSCNQTVDMLYCDESYNLAGYQPETAQLNIISCRNVNGVVCHEDDELKNYSVDVVGIVEQLIISANVTFNQAQPSNLTDLMSYARFERMPLETLNDFSGDLSKGPLVIPFPKAGRWYITVQPTHISNISVGVGNNNLRVCYSLNFQVFQCPVNKAGLNCTSEKYILQTVIRRNPSLPFESIYVPMSGKVLPEISKGSDDIFVEPLLTNITKEENGTWTYFLIDIPRGATGGNIHFRLKSDLKINYQIYARYGGLPSLTTWDYFYANSSVNSNGSMFFKLYDSSEDTISLYLLYAQTGTWCFGLRNLNPVDPKSQTAMSLSLERCPKRCSSHGTCQFNLDTSGLDIYSYCACDRNHGGFDCSVELVTHHGHVRQSIFLIASNVAFVLPAYWSLRNKAFSEWVLFTSSGISSGLYHACDVGTWCVMKFHVLQFLDFWLSFMAIVSTFVYLATISEGSKRTIHTVVAILTALMAETGPTRSSNIGYVIGIGTLGLLVAWLIECCTCTHYRSFSFSTECHLNLLASWEAIKGWMHSIIKTIRRRFRWGLVLAGFAALTMAALNWKLESTESYWIWHSLWHVSIYTSSFFFLCSKAKVESCEENGRPSGESYELTRQNSFSGGEQRQER